METIIYILGSAIGLFLSLHIYKVCQSIGIRFFLRHSFKESLLDETKAVAFSPARLLLFWITKTPFPLITSLPSSDSNVRVFKALALLCGPLGLLVVSFFIYFLHTTVLSQISIINDFSSIFLQIAVLTSWISLLPVPPLDGIRILTILISPRREATVLQYHYVFPVVILIASFLDVVTGLHIIHKIYAYSIDIILLLFQLGLTP